MIKSKSTAACGTIVSAHYDTPLIGATSQGLQDRGRNGVVEPIAVVQPVLRPERRSPYHPRSHCRRRHTGGRLKIDEAADRAGSGAWCIAPASVAAAAEQLVAGSSVVGADVRCGHASLQFVRL